MNNIVHNFKKSINVGDYGEQIIKSYLEDNPNIVSIIDVSKVKEYQDKDIDFIVKLKNDEDISIELKTDTYDTGNIFYEAISNQEYNVLGCMIKSKAKCLFYYIFSLVEIGFSHLGDEFLHPLGLVVAIGPGELLPAASCPEEGELGVDAFL